MRPCAVSQPIVERATVESGGGGGGDDDDDPPIADRRPGRPLASVLRRFAVRAPLACGQEALTRDGLGVGSMVYGVSYQFQPGFLPFLPKLHFDTSFEMLALPLAAAALLGLVGHPTPRLTSVRRFAPDGASVSSSTFRLPVACPARTPAVTAKVGGYASEPDDPIAPAPPAPPVPPAPLVLDATTKKQLAIIVSTSFLVQLGVGMGIIVLPVFAQSLGLGQLGVGLLVALPQVTKLLFNLPVGYLVDVVGRKPPLVLGAVIDALGQIMTAAASSMTQLVPARLVVGVGSATGGSTGAAATAYQMDVLAKYPEHSGRLLGLIQALGFLA